MDAAQISSRLRQAFDQRADLLRSHVGVAFHEEPTLSPSVAHFFFISSEILAVLRELRSRFPEQVEAIVQEAERICAHQFRLLGYLEISRTVVSMQVGNHPDAQGPVYTRNFVSLGGGSFARLRLTRARS
jgi:hypothetical protein